MGNEVPTISVWSWHSSFISLAFYTESFKVERVTRSGRGEQSWIWIEVKSTVQKDKAKYDMNIENK